MPWRSVPLLLLPVLALTWLGERCLMQPPSGATAGEKKSSPPPTNFDKVAVPFVTKHCVHCHGPEKKKADLTLHQYKDATAILKDRKVWQHVLQMVQSGEMPPRDRPKPAVAEIEAFSQTVNTVFAQADKGNRDPGRVTMRRLNRTEYNNTIRDLVGVDFQPAEDFPSDDVGHGFDNIGDVLTLSPILMERYLAAAENIMERAILVNPPKPAVRRMSSRYLEPALPGNAPNTRFRGLFTKGPLHTPFNLTQPGDYKARVRVYGQQAGAEPVRLTLSVDGKELKTLDVTATEKTPLVVEAPVTLDPGSRRVAVAFLNEFKDDKNAKKRGLMVEFIELEGPMDPRPPSQQKILATRPGLSKPEQTREILTRFASRAYRRPAATEEVDRLIKLVGKVEARGEKWEAGIQLALQAVLVSPKFLFRIEMDDQPNHPEPHPLNDYQLASRLSYFLWSSMPDDELMTLAAKGKLHQNLEAQIQRMLQDTKARALVENFAAQWLQIRILKNVMPDPKQFPDFDEPLRAAMMKETELFFEAILRENRSLLDLLDGNFTFLNERLARHYGIADTNGNRFGQKKTARPGQPIRGKEFQRVTFSDEERGGLLTHASVLTITSNPTRTSPVKRGRWVLEQILGTPPPPPPPNVPELVDNDKAVLSGSLRQRMEQHRTNPNCASCHARMDPLGFAFENYNAIGKFRTKDGAFAIDASGTLPNGQSFKGPGELKVILKGKRDLFARCLTEKMLTYALGRGLEYYDKAAVDDIVTALSRNDYRFATLVLGIAKSDPFRLRRGKDKKQ